jgi:hypothetical protein
MLIKKIKEELRDTLRKMIVDAVDIAMSKVNLERWEIASVNVNPNDTIVLRHSGVLSETAILRLKQSTNELLNVKRVIILEEGLDMIVLHGSIE